MTHARGTRAILGRPWTRSLGLLFLAGYIIGIVGLAAGITYAVIRIFPTERNPKKDDGPEKPSANSGGETGRRQPLPPVEAR